MNAIVDSPLRVWHHSPNTRFVRLVNIIVDSSTRLIFLKLLYVVSHFMNIAQFVPFIVDRQFWLFQKCHPEYFSIFYVLVWFSVGSIRKNAAMAPGIYPCLDRECQFLKLYQFALLPTLYESSIHSMSLPTLLLSLVFMRAILAVRRLLHFQIFHLAFMGI